MYAYPTYDLPPDPVAESEAELDLYLLDQSGMLDEDDCLCAQSDLDYYGACVCGA